MRSFILLFLLSICCFACTIKQEADLDRGLIYKGDYVNRQFNIRFPLLEDFYVGDHDGKSHLIKDISIDFLPSWISITQAKESRLIFLCYKFPVDSELAINPNLAISAMNIKGHSYLKKSSRAIKLAKEELSSLNSSFVINESKINLETEIGNIPGFKSFLIINDVVVNYETYILNSGNFNVSFTISYAEESQRNELIEMLAALTLFKATD